jgi:hypothetical protein
MNLQPVDFKAVAAKGWYVYAYLNEQGRPYYIGIGSTANRPFRPHNCEIPPRERVCLLRSGLPSKQWAGEWEIFFIDHYGRMCEGTGTLENNARGGQTGSSGWVPSEETKKLISKRRKGIKLSAKAKAQGVATRMANGSYAHSDEWKENNAKLHTGRKNTSATKSLMSEVALANRHNRVKAAQVSVEIRQRKTAAKFGISFEQLSAFTQKQLTKARNGHNRKGIKGVELLAYVGA